MTPAQRLGNERSQAAALADAKWRRDIKRAALSGDVAAVRSLVDDRFWTAAKNYESFGPGVRRIIDATLSARVQVIDAERAERTDEFELRAYWRQRKEIQRLRKVRADAARAALA